MPESVSIERVKILKAFGAKVLLTPAEKGIDSAIIKAREIVKSFNNYIMLNQFKNFANPRAHYETTGIKIWEQTKGKITHFVAGLGTTGTITGVGKRLKECNPKIKIIAEKINEGLIVTIFPDMGFRYLSTELFSI